MVEELDERKAISRQWGKWGQSGVPHKGWMCVDHFDLGPDDMQTCAMCERMEIRFVHVMRHPSYPGDLECGCVCAGHMEEDLATARRREASMRKTAKRRQSFPSLKGWSISQKGNPWIKHEGWHVVVFPRRGGFCVRYSRDGQEGTFLSGVFPSEHEAKLAAFDAVEAAKLARAKAVEPDLSASTGWR